MAAQGKANRMTHHRTGTSVCIALLLVLLAALRAQAQQPRDCEPPKYAGITHCTEDNGKTHVLLVDLSNSKIRFETVLAAYNDPRSGNWVECTDVNIPRWALYGRGCAYPNTDRYPGQTVAEMVARYPGAAAAINTDYFGMPNYDHGPEGLTIKNGRRLDGWRNGDCDGSLNHDPQNPNSTPTPCQSQSNDTKRTSMSISRSNSVEIGPKPFADVDNPTFYADRFYNAVGGGPLIVQNGMPVLSKAKACEAEKLKDGEGACLRTLQSAAGITRDKRTLVLVMSGMRDAYSLADLLAKNYQIETAMKFDGGGSAQMWYDGREFYGGTEKRPVVEALVVFAAPVSDFDAAIKGQSEMAILDPRQKAKMFIEVVNSGGKKWAMNDVALMNTNGQTFNLPSRLSLKSDVPPGQIQRWDFEITAPNDQGIHSSDWQLQQNGKSFGPKITLRVTVLPGAVRDWRDQFLAWLASLPEQIWRWVADLIQRQLQQTCAGHSALLVLAALIVSRRIRRDA